MSAGPTIEAWVRGRFVAIPGATAERIRANAWTVRVPRTQEAARALRVKQVSLSSLDELVLSLDEVESTMAVVSGENERFVEVSVLL